MKICLFRFIITCITKMISTKLKHYHIDIRIYIFTHIYIYIYIYMVCKIKYTWFIHWSFRSHSPIFRWLCAVFNFLFSSKVALTPHESICQGNICYIEEIVWFHSGAQSNIPNVSSLWCTPPLHNLYLWYSDIVIYVKVSWNLYLWYSDIVIYVKVS